MATNKEIVQSAYDAFTVGDVPTVLGLLDEKVEWNEAEGFPIYSGTVVGPQAVLEQVFMRLGEVGDGFSVNVRQLVAEDDTVVALGTYSWTRGSGEPAEVQMAHVLTLRDGKVVTFRQHVDTVRVREQLG